MQFYVRWQRVEGLLVFVAALPLVWYFDPGMAWWAALLLFFAPDVSFAFYGFGKRLGAMAYNGVHIYGFGLALVAIGLISGLFTLAALGALWVAHCGFDRMLGYGLKSLDGFGETHLGRIGRAA